MDDLITIHELSRLEAERKVRTIPPSVLETAWVREAQVEAVIDAILAVALGPDARANAHARHVGELCARIAEHLEFGPGAAFARRVGVLADVDPSALERIAEVRHLCAYVREIQKAALVETGDVRTMSLIAMVADEFDSRVCAYERGRAPSPRAILRAMLANADERSKPIVEALARAMRRTPGVIASTAAQR